MKVVRLAVLAVCGLLVAVPMCAQGIPRGARVGQANSVLRLMVANPYVLASADSAAAVQVGSAMREEVEGFVGDDYQVVAQQQMNEALQQYGYPIDAILNPPVAVDLAKHINARVVVAGTMVKGGSGQYTVTARLAGVNDSAGNVVTVEKQPSEVLIDFGHRIGDALEPAVKSLGDAKACMDEWDTKPDKAMKSAEKALKKVPNHGLAQFCLYQIAKQQKAPREEAIKHLEAAVKGDPLGLPAWLRLANEYSDANDTANTLQAFKQLLRVAPTNHELRHSIFRYFLDSGHPKLALEVAEEGLKIDSLNPEFYDLKANACLFLKDFKCTLNALETVYTVDSTKADTTFFKKAVAAAREAPDTAMLLHWTQLAVRKFPDDTGLLNSLNLVYVWTGQVDSSVAVTTRIIQRDTTNVLAALAAVQALAQSKRMTEATPFVDFIKRYGNPQQKNLLAGIWVSVAAERLRGDSAAGVARDVAGATELARLAIEAADSSGDVAGQAHYILGLSLFLRVDEMDPETERQKSCDMAKQEQELLAESKEHLVKGQGARPMRAQQYLGYIETFDPRIAAMLKQYCK